MKAATLIPPFTLTRRVCQSGVALITAMLVMAIVSVAAAAMISRQHFDLRRTENILRSDQAYQFALGGEHWAKGILVKDHQTDTKTSNPYDGLDEDWAQPLPPTPVEGGQIAGQIFDLQARFNINNLESAIPPPIGAGGTPPPGKPLFKDYFVRVLDNLGLNQALPDLFIDWIDKDINATFPNGAEDIDYLNLDIPYRTANAYFFDPSEIRLIKGVDSKTYQALLPLLTALPENNLPINVNTAPEILLKSLTNSITDVMVENLIQRRESSPFESERDFLNELEAMLGPGSPLPADIGDLISVESNYFLIDGRVQYDRSRIRVLSTIHLNNAGQSSVMMRTRDLF